MHRPAPWLWSAPWLLALAAALGPAGALFAQPAKPLTFDGKLTKDDAADLIRKESRHKVHELQLEKGQAYLIELSSRDFDTYLRLEDADGAILAENDDAGPDDLNSRLGFVPTQAGKYRAVVTSFKGGQTGAYRLAVHPLERVGEPMPVAGKLTKTSPKDQGRHFAAHPVKLRAGALYLVEMEAKGFPPSLFVGDGRGQMVGSDANPGGAKRARALFVPETAGVYRLTAVSAKPGATGAYWVTLQGYEVPAGLAPATAAVGEGGPAPIQGRLTADDARDRVRKGSFCKVHEVKLEEGQKYRIDLVSREFDTYLRLEDKNGKTLDENDDVSKTDLNSRLLFTPTKTDTYKLVVTTYDPGKTGAYRLTVRPQGAPKEKADERALLEQQVETLNVAATKHLQRGEHKAAARLLDEALALGRKLYPKEKYPDGHVILAHSLNNLGTLLHDLGKREEARDYLEQALAIRKKVLPPDHPQLATSLNNLGMLLHGLGKREEARRHLEQALAIMEKALPPDHPLLAPRLLNMGSVLHELGQREEARRYYEQALAIIKKALPPDYPLLAHSLNNLGMLLRDMGQFEEARRPLEQALAIRKKALPPDHPHLAYSLNNLGRLLHDLGQLQEARRYLEEALAIWKEALPPDHPDLAGSLNNLGLLLHDLGQLQEARRHYEQALAIRKKAQPPDHPHLALSLNNLGRLLWQLRRYDEARPLLAGSVTSSASYHRRLATALAQRDHPALLRQQRSFLDVLLSAARDQPPPAERRHDLLLALLEAKGISTAAWTSRRDALLRQADPSARALADKLTPLQRRLADLMLQGPGELSPRQHRDECVTLQREVDKLERELGKHVQAFALLQQVHTATPRQVAGRLPPGAVLVETARHREFRFGADAGKQWGPARFAAVLLWADAGGAQVRVLDLGDAEALERAIASWRAAVQQGAGGAAAEQALRQRLWDPLAKALPPGTKRLVIAPDGALSLLPLEAIRLDDGKYLIEHYAIQYVSTGRDLMPLPLPKERPDLALVLADPDYNLAAGEPAARAAGGADGLRARLEFKRLAGFATEADAVAKLLKGQAGWRVVLGRGEGASEEALAKVSRPRLLHLVTHGFFLEDVRRGPPKDLFRDLEIAGASRPRVPNFGENPRLRSGLALAGANKWQERSAKGLSDGLLTALEVENLDLWGTELVVLSACDTGRGQIQVGEGVLGLRRAFQLAGAQTVIASLWKVPDAETERLMTDTLGRWLNGAPPHEALREAQLAMIRHLRQAGARNGKQGEAPPLYWAGFICHGQPR